MADGTAGEGHHADVSCAKYFLGTPKRIGMLDSSSTSLSSMPEAIVVEGLSNAEFFERYAAPGRIGLYGGPELINRAINRAQRHLNEDHAWSRWSHAFVFQGRRH